MSSHNPIKLGINNKSWSRKKKHSKYTFVKKMEHAENADMEPELGKSPNVDQSLGVYWGASEIVQPRASQLQGFFSKSVQPRRLPHLPRDTLPVQACLCSGRGLSLPAGKAIAGLRCGPWKGHSFYSPDVCLLKALSPAVPPSIFIGITFNKSLAVKTKTKTWGMFGGRAVMRVARYLKKRQIHIIRMTVPVFC